MRIFLVFTFLVGVSPIAGCATELHLDGEPPPVVEPPEIPPPVVIPGPELDPRFPHVSPPIELDSTIGAYAGPFVGSNPTAAFDGELHLVAWLEREFVHGAWSTVVRAARVTVDGEVLDPGGIALGTTDLSVSSRNHAPSVAAAPGQFFVAWGSTTESGLSYMRVRAEDGALLDARGTTLPVGEHESSPPVVTFFEGDFVIGFTTDGAAKLAFFDSETGRVVVDWSRRPSSPRIHSVHANAAIAGLAVSGDRLLALVSADPSNIDGSCAQSEVVLLEPNADYQVSTVGSLELWPEDDPLTECTPFAIAGHGDIAVVATVDTTALRLWKIEPRREEVAALVEIGLDEPLRHRRPVIAGTDEGFFVAAALGGGANEQWQPVWIGTDFAQQALPRIEATDLAVSDNHDELLLARHHQGPVGGGPEKGLLEIDFLGSVSPHAVRSGDRVFSAAVQDDAAVAENGEVALTVWVDRRGGGNDPSVLRGRFIDQFDGMPQGAPFDLFGCQGNDCSVFDPAVASNGDGFLVVWSWTSGFLFHRRFLGLRLAADGTPLDDVPFVLGVSSYHSADPVVVPEGDGYRVAFRSFRPVQDYCNCYESQHAIVTQHVPAVGNPQPAAEVTDRGERLFQRPTLATDGDGLLLAWQERLPRETTEGTCHAPCGGDRTNVRAAELTTDGAVLPWGGVEVSETEHASAPAASFGDGHYVLVWRDTTDVLQQGDVHMRAFAPGGLRPTGPSIAIVDTPFSDESHRIIADGDDGFLITWVTDQTLWATRFTLGGPIDDAHVLEVHVGDSGSFWRSSGGLVRAAPGEFLSVFTHIDSTLGRHRAKARFIVYDGEGELR